MIERSAKAMDSIDPYRHGRASLKIRCPRLRVWEGQQGQVQELCEIYSEVTMLHDLMSKAGDEEAAAKYEELRLALEEDVHHYLVFYNDAEGDVPLATISAWCLSMNDLPTRLNDGFGQGLIQRSRKRSLEALEEIPCLFARKSVKGDIADDHRPACKSIDYRP